MREMVENDENGRKWWKIVENDGKWWKMVMRYAQERKTVKQFSGSKKKKQWSPLPLVGKSGYAEKPHVGFGAFVYLKSSHLRCGT